MTFRVYLLRDLPLVDHLVSNLLFNALHERHWLLDTVLVLQLSTIVLY
jgi:hypothetical protein